MDNIFSVSEITRHIKKILTLDIALSNIWARGEISNYKHHSSGHIYFTLKDETSVLKCIMFRSKAELLKIKPENGMKVLVKGNISVYEREGQYQLYAQSIKPDGIGELSLAFIQLKKKLKEEGLFEDANKKPLPILPRRIVVITSPTGSVIKDIMNVLFRRFENVKLNIFPVSVQGKTSANEIAHAIDKINELKDVDVIILARGGGSLEELWAFNEEVVARSIYKSKIPIISAIGHETDYTISDFVADVRAPTPSAASEIVIAEKQNLKRSILTQVLRLKKALNENYNLKRLRLDYVKKSIVFKQPLDRVFQEKMRLNNFCKYLVMGINNLVDKNRDRLSNRVEKLNALSPLSVLSRGYSVVKSKDEGKIIKSIIQVKKGQSISVGLSDGSMDCIVEKLFKGDDNGE